MSATETSPHAIPRTALQFLLYDWLDAERLVERERFAGQSRELYDEVLALSETMAADLFAPHNALADANEPHLAEDGSVVLIPEVQAALDAYGEVGLIGASLDSEIGGMQLPHLIGSAAFTIFQAANVGTSAYAMLTTAAANMLMAHGSPEQIERFAGPMVAGRFFGTMCLSEPQAGSSLADITTRAEAREDGSYRIFGSKMWISGGDHEMGENIIHMVLAKVPGGAPGVKGIGLFIVPRRLLDPTGDPGERNDVVLAGLNHKMGYRGTVNTALSFGDGSFTPGGEAGAVAYLVGESSKGLAYMFHMMNEARIGVGLGATAIGAASHARALGYARERLQGRPPGQKDPASPQVPIIRHADVRRMLLASKSYVEGALALGLYCARLVDEQRTAPDEHDRERASLLLEVLTPIAKSWPSHRCLAASDIAIQIHGGYGYTRDYQVEQLYRDNRLNPIHEGTTGIQAADLLGRKVALRGGAALEALVEAIETTIGAARAAGGDRAAYAESLAPRVARLTEVTAVLLGEPDVELRLANAVSYLEATGDVVIAWLWLDQLAAAAGKEGDLYDGKRQTARYFFIYELPRVDARLNLLAGADATALAMRDEWF